jgi:hypothetical protein
MLVESSYDHHHGQVAIAEASHDFKPAHYGHPKIEKNEIRLKLLDFLQRLFAVFGLTGDFDIRDRLQAFS